MDKKKTTNMYELLSVNNDKSKQDPLSNPQPSSSTEAKLNTISGFINSPLNLTNDNTPKIQNDTKIIKGDFYKDPELISKNCGLFEPETPVIYTESEVVFNEQQKYKGILVLTEYRLIFEFFDKEQKKTIKLPKDYLRFPIFSISKVEKNLNTKDYNIYLIDITMKDSRFLRFSIVGSVNYNFFLYLESKVNPKNPKELYKFTQSYNSVLKKEKNYYNGWLIYDPIREFTRQGVSEDNNLGLRFCYVNKDFSLCESYPEFLIAPKNIVDSQLKAAAQYRTKGRLPIMAYYYSGNMDDGTNYVPTIWR